jgi:hypothetical protein
MRFERVEQGVYLCPPGGVELNADLCGLMPQHQAQKLADFNVS